MGRNFCNKLWNAARFAMMNLKGTPAWEQVHAADNLSDAWILSRLNRTARDVTEALSAYQFHEAAEALYRCMWNDFCDWYLEIAKVRINAGEASPKAVLAHALDMLLRLLHPMIPFITEQIWGQLNALTPVRGPGNRHAEPLLVQAAWPAADAATIQDATESRFEMLQALISGLREVRNGHNIPPVQKLSVVIVAEGDAAAVIQANRSLVESLAGVESLRIDPAGKAGKKDATVLAGAVSAFVQDVVDPQAESLRLTKRQGELAKGISGAQGKLNNPKFIERAKPDIVAAERERLAAMQAELESVERSLKALG
jgi:valyl-tRNA synthetase